MLHGSPVIASSTVKVTRATLIKMSYVHIHIHLYNNTTHVWANLPNQFAKWDNPTGAAYLWHLRPVAAVPTLVSITHVYSFQDWLAVIVVIDTLHRTTAWNDKSVLLSWLTCNGEHHAFGDDQTLMTRGNVLLQTIDEIFSSADFATTSHSIDLFQMCIFHSHGTAVFCHYHHPLCVTDIT